MEAAGSWLAVDARGPTTTVGALRRWLTITLRAGSQEVVVEGDPTLGRPVGDPGSQAPSLAESWSFRYDCDTQSSRVERCVAPCLVLNGCCVLAQEQCHRRTNGCH